MTRACVRAMESRQGRRGSGFSLLELMVALGVGAIAITSIYAVGASTTRQFNRQEQLAGTQTALRFAMSQLKRDIARAGYLSTPNVTPPLGAVPQTCGVTDATLNTSAVKLAAFSQFFNDPTPVAAVKPNTSNAAADFTADRISLIGNYETTAEYAGIELFDTDTIAIPTDWHAFQRDFTNWYEATPGVYQDAAFKDVFKVGRMIRIQTTQRKRHFAIITQVTSPTVGERPRIKFQPAIPDICKPFVNNGWVAPVSVIELSVRNMANNAGNAEATGPVGQLMRREMMPGVDDRAQMLRMTGLNEDTDNVNSRSILDFVVAFNLRFTRNTPGTISGAPDNYQVGVTINDQTQVNDAPELIRSVLIDVAVRAPYQDPTRDWTAAICGGMRCFRVFDDRAGSAAVRRMRTEVFVPNVAYEGY